MEVNSKIQESAKLIQWMDNEKDGLEINSDNKTRISAACFDVALEHQKAIVLLISENLVGAAFSLVRSEFEAYIRGLWLGKCATNDEIEKFKNQDKIDRTIGNMIQEIEQLDGFQDGVLSKAKTAIWRVFSSYTHTGKLQIARRLTEETVEPNYTKDEKLTALLNANACGILAAMQIAQLAGKEKFMNELIEKIEKL
jgi:hypothetical protein